MKNVFGIVIILNTAAMPIAFGLNEEDTPFVFGLRALPMLLRNRYSFRLDIYVCNLS